MGKIYTGKYTQGHTVMHALRAGGLRPKRYRCLEIFLKSLEGKGGSLRIYKDGEDMREYPAGDVRYTLHRIPLENDSEYKLELLDCEVSIAYLSESEDMMDTGVRFLEYVTDEMRQNKAGCGEGGLECTSLPEGTGNWTEIQDLGAWYDTPNREQYHFNAYKNWINDPNGLCYYKGYYHLYYQANPHSQEWDVMYWGHAASKDLLHWVHLPYTLQPQEEILAQKELRGGAFSGSAVALEDEIVFYLTRHIGTAEETKENTRQYQTMVRSKDGIHFGEEVKVVERLDDTFSFNNFRDPKAYWLDGRWQMVIGTKVNGIPSLVRYSSADMEKWDYAGVLVEERTEGVYTFECPDFFALDGRFVAAGSWVMYRDAQQRYQPTYWYIGDYQDGSFIPESKGTYDFGSNFYAVQSFEHDGRRIAIGWTADFYQEHVPEANGSCGAMTIPRELSVRNGRLYQKPAEEIYRLRGEKICDAAAQNLAFEKVEGNCYYARIDLTEDTDFRLLLGRSEAGEIQLEREGVQVRIRTKGVRSENVQFVTEVEQLQKAEIFVDRRLIEVYLNDGEAVGTKLFYQDNRDGVFQAEFGEAAKVGRVCLWKMDGIWRK